ncbi:mechanosensitive ion channel domain-containing protein [Antarcticirhabdus aurantiaca]|uniref:Mechanosensitive ion channel n=1 Tax=Antarcticirhabdus aurantiaca TaxID=2606717 RepID=A0ACD4NU28_9HYPH|nr:mechanosensitive ion channel domain-containing protein [Antarcticirhabdus aurantiaca]WAJ30215.1 mechanosensitive ion channel [Jeongeuplla avenae]
MPFFIPSRIADNIWLSLSIAAVVLALRFAGVWLAGRGEDLALARRRRFTIRAVADLVLALALLAVWISEIQSVVLSLAAVMVALVVATKELIMCVAGSVLRLSGHLFKVGDRIEMNGIHGEVIDHGLFSTTIMELPAAHLGHAGTGRVVMLPNSVLLTGPVRVGAQPRHFAPHRFVVTMEHPVAPGPALALLGAAAERVLGPDRERAARFHRMATNKAGADIAGPGFQLAVRTSEIGKMQFHVMAYCLVQDALAVEQAITSEFLDALIAPGVHVGEGARPGPAEDVAPAPPTPVLSRAWAEIARSLRDGSARGAAANGERKDAAA